MPLHSTELANEFIRRSHSGGKKLTQMQLQKLVYIAHGWNLAINGTRLVEDDPCAWDYGPVFPDLWEALRGYGRSPVTKPIKIGDYGLNAFRPDAEKAATGTLTDAEKQLVDKVHELYSPFHAFQLSAMTHQEGTPWHNTYVEENNKKGVISDDLIREHFVELAQKRKKAA